MQNLTACSLSVPKSNLQTAPVALVVDDDATNRKVLAAMLRLEGYKVEEASDGREAVQRFKDSEIDLVLMDVMMPRMDGYEATMQIKRVAGERFVPVIFLTAIEDEMALVRCVESGGDDFMTKPYKMPLLKAKVSAMARIRELHRENERQRKQIETMYSRLMREEEIAEHLFSKAVNQGNVGESSIRVLRRSAVTFSGDLFITEHAPGGDLHVLMGDFTGHGLSAAIGALPASEVFRAMSRKGYAMPEILRAINQKLFHLLPRGMFMAACAMVLPRDMKSLAVWNADMPDVLLLDAQGLLRQRFKPDSLPLGIVDAAEMNFTPAFYDIANGDRVLMYSDGVLDAMSPAGERFGEERLLQVVLGKSAEDGFSSVVNALDAFTQDFALQDDASLVEIPCLESVFKVDMPVMAGQKDAGCRAHWEWSLALHGASLRETNPIPLAIHYLSEAGGLQEHRQALYTILTELYCNALDHGVLGLDSSIKTSAEGFSQYFEMRENLLTDINAGWLTMQITHFPQPQGGEIIIQVRDSGQGFKVENWLEAKIQDSQALCGRGLFLVRSLCDDVQFQDQGAHVRAIYRYQSASLVEACAEQTDAHHP